MPAKCKSESLQLGKSMENLKIEDATQVGKRGGGSEHSHQGNLDGTSKSPKKGAVRREQYKIQTA